MPNHRHFLVRSLLALLLGAAFPAIGSSQSLTIGERAPDFSVASVDGRSSIRLSDFRGRRVLIFNWATW